MDNIIRVAFAYIGFVYLKSYSNSIDRFADVSQFIRDKQILPHQEQSTIDPLRNCSYRYDPLMVK